MGIKEILDLLSVYGTPLVITAVVIYYAIKLINSRFREDKYNQLHHIFPDLEMIANTTIKNASFGTEGRNELFRVMLSIKYRVFTDLYKGIYDKFINTEKINNDDFYNEHIQFAQKLIATYEKEWEMKGIPKVVIDKFNEWHNPRLEMGIADRREIANSNLHKTGRCKTYAVSDLYCWIMKTALMDGEKTLRTLNGQITGLEFNGKVC